MARGGRPASDDPLSVLDVIDELVVGPPRVERRRVTTPYSVRAGGREDSLDHIFRFEEDVFEPGDPASENLAAFMTAQVALNYGLFCGTITFRGLFDQADIRFLKDAASNTSREIYVIKLLQDNPFIRGPVASLPALKLADHTRAELAFPDSLTGGAGPPAAGGGADLPWGGDGAIQRVAVLSSGGKDSLLSYGLLDEMGQEVHPVFVNESGRHWFTALNSYRHFSSNVPGTARVWTNSDRMFSWVLRHLPFVRQDFASVRSDEYPIRLWTVAVFVAAALPLLRKRGIGRLVIGDEYDTTVRSTYKGITHYNGLYDQSRYFDNAMTRFYMRKGWGVQQFSILRPLSELLIEKTLVERYPDLQRHQLSCHATHKEGDSVHPCGNCEKCRRIVGMLLALGAEPGNCGYTKEQVDRCLKALADRGVHQESEGAQHLYHMLAGRGLIPPSENPRRMTERPEVMSMRFDSEKSGFDSVPLDLRAPLYGIQLEHALGAVKRVGRVWVDFDPLGDPSFSTPYPHGAGGTAKAVGTHGVSAPKTGGTVMTHDEHILGNLTWPEAKKRFKTVDLALLPVGSVEQHGPHLPLDTDAYDADRLAREAASRCSEPKPFVLPLISYGVSYHHMDFSGTLSVSPNILSQLVYEIGMSIARHGVTKLVIVNGHGGNTPALRFAAQNINRDAHIFTCVESGETSDADIAKIADTPNDVHAGEIETSTALATRPDMVHMEKAKKFVPRFSTTFLDFSSKRSVEWYARTAKISNSGVLGDPTKAGKEKGERIWDVMIGRLVEFLEGLKEMSLGEIYDRRY